MARAPTPRGEPLLTRAMRSRMALMTPAITVSTLGWFMWRDSQGIDAAQVQTETFTVLAVCQWFNVLNCRSATRSALSRDIVKNRWLIGGLGMRILLQLGVVYLPFINGVFHTTPIGFAEVLGIGAAASLVLWLVEARKFMARRDRS